MRSFNNFSKGINLKVNLIALLEFKLTYFKVRVQHFSHYTVKILEGLFLSWV